MILNQNSKFKIQNFTENLHHAYLIPGNSDEVVPVLKDALASGLGVATGGNPDFWVGEFETFGIDDSRAVKAMQSRKAFAGGKKVFIVTAHFFTREAQNSLLKVFEEPTEHTHFFIITPNTESLLPTLKSRLFTLSVQEETDGVSPKGSVAEAFLQSGKAKRMELVSDIIESKDKNRAIMFLNELESALYRAKGAGASVDMGARQTFAEIAAYRSYLNDRSPSVKMILEHLALTVAGGKRRS